MLSPPSISLWLFPPSSLSPHFHLLLPLLFNTPYTLLSMSSPFPFMFFCLLLFAPLPSSLPMVSFPLARPYFFFLLHPCVSSFLYLLPLLSFPSLILHLFTFVSSSFAFSVFIHTSCVLPSLNVLLSFPLIYLPFLSFLFHPSPPPSPLSPTILLFTSFPTLSLISFPSQHFLLSFPTLNLLMSLRCLPSSFLFPSPPQIFLPSPFSCLLTSSW